MQDVVLKSWQKKDGQKNFKIKLHDGRILEVSASDEHEAHEKIAWGRRQGIIEAWNDWSI